MAIRMRTLKDIDINLLVGFKPALTERAYSQVAGRTYGLSQTGGQQRAVSFAQT